MTGSFALFNLNLHSAVFIFKQHIQTGHIPEVVLLRIHTDTDEVHVKQIIINICS